MDYADKTIKCVEETCGHKEFVVTAGEQSFFANKGFALPRRCKECRIAKKAQIETKARSPFTPILNQIRSNDRTTKGWGGTSDDRDYGKPRRAKKEFKRNRRHGREGIGNFEGE